MRHLLWLFFAGLFFFSCDNISPSKTGDDDAPPIDSDISDEAEASDIDNWSADNNDMMANDNIVSEEEDGDEPTADATDTTQPEEDLDIEVDSDFGGEDSDMSLDDDESTDADLPATESDIVQPDGNDLDAVEEPDEPTDADIPDEFPDSDNRYVIQGDAVIDNFRGLMWQKGNSDVITQYAAITYCENLGLNGWYDWRLPTISELRMIIEGCFYTSYPENNYDCEVNDTCLSQSCGDGTCNCATGLGPDEDGLYCEPGVWDNCNLQLWSSSLVYDHDPYAWVVYYNRAWAREWNRNQTSSARCVRDL